MDHPLVSLVPPSLSSLGPSAIPSPVKEVFPWLDPQPKGKAHHCPGGEDLHDCWLGALAAGLIVLHHEAAGQLAGRVGEAAGGWWVGANCEGQRWLLSVARSGEHVLTLNRH